MRNEPARIQEPVPPGPGVWQLDVSHFSHPVTHFYRPILARGFEEGQAEWLAAYGAPLRTIKARFVDGFFYAQPEPLAGPPDAKPPPTFVFWLVVRLLPLFRRLRRTADDAYARRQWRLDAARWSEERWPALAARLRAIQAEQVEDLVDAALADHVQRLVDLATDVQRAHFATNGATMFPMGMLLRAVAGWTEDFDPGLVFEAVGGESTVREEAERALDALVEALADEPPASGGAAIEALRRRDDAVGEAARAWLDLVEPRQVLAGDVDQVIGGEVPHLLAEQLRSRLAAGGAEPSDPAKAREAALAELRGRVPGEHHEELDRLIEEARATNYLRDERCALADAWANGLARRALLEVGRRLASRGGLEAPGQAIHLTPPEVVAHLTTGEGPDAAEVAQRARNQARSVDEMPTFLGGEPPADPPFELIPGALGRMTAGLMAYVGLMEGDLGERPEEDDGSVAGVGASAGSHVGIARVVEGPADFARVRPGDVLVARATMPSYNGPLAVAGAVVTDRGGALSHAAIVARELGIPAVVGTLNATAAIPDGATVRVDGQAGTVEVIAPPGAEAAAPSPAEARGEAPGSPKAGVALEPDPEGGIWIVPLSAVTDVDRFGGKAGQLGETLRQGLPVPPGFALSASTVAAVAAGDPDAREAVAVLWRHEFEGLRVAVRSSGVGEDSGQASFAGQHLTVLGVRGLDELLDAVEQVHRSGRTDAARAYRDRLGLAGPPRVGVVVQRMLEPECAGVLFTREPTDGSDVRVIEAAWGLGEAVVSGLVKPDRYVLARGGAPLRQEVGLKDLAVLLAPDGGTREVPVAPERAGAPCLGDRELAALEELAARCEAGAEGGLDIEWAFQGGDLFLVQRRPITR